MLVVAVALREVLLLLLLLLSVRALLTQQGRELLLFESMFVVEQQTILRTEVL